MLWDFLPVSQCCLNPLVIPEDTFRIPSGSPLGFPWAYLLIPGGVLRNPVRYVYVLAPNRMASISAEVPSAPLSQSSSGSFGGSPRVLLGYLEDSFQEPLRTCLGFPVGSLISWRALVENIYYREHLDWYLVNGI